MKTKNTECDLKDQG